jgi:CDP-paratose synthetase
MRVLMTGASGFLGSHLLARMLREPQCPEITILKRSFSDTRRIMHLLSGICIVDLDRQQMEEAFRDKTYDIVLHCATNYGRGQVSRTQIIEPNLLLPLRLLDLSAKHGARVFINTDTMLDKNVSDYTLSKQQFSEWLRRPNANMTCINMLLEHFYGPGDDNTKFVSGLVGALLTGQPEIALTEGLQTRDFVFIDDVTDAFLHVVRCADLQSGYLEYEVGSGHPTRLRDFVELARTLCGNTTTHLRFGALPYRPNEPMNVVADISRLQALGWTSRWTLHEGLKETIRSDGAVAKGTRGRHSLVPLGATPGRKGTVCGI